MQRQLRSPVIITTSDDEGRTVYGYALAIDHSGRIIISRERFSDREACVASARKAIAVQQGSSVAGVRRLASG